MRWLGALLLAVSTTAAAQTAPTPAEAPAGREVVAGLRAAAKPLRTVTPEADVSDLSFVCPWTKRASVVSLGEPGHGAHEPLSFRNRLFEYLVEQCGFTAIALETAFSESRAVHDFVDGGAGDAAQLVRTHLSWGFGEFQENVQLVEWMRTYNRRHAARRPIEFYGIDLSGADKDSGFPDAVIALSSVLDFLRRAAPHASESLRASLAPMVSRWAGDGYAKAAQDEDPDLGRAQRSLSRFLITHATTLRQATSRSQYDWAVRGLVVADRLRQLLALESATSDAKGMGPDDYRQVNVRDAAMASNVLWVKRQERGGKILVFAHDAHVMNAKTRGGIWSVFSEAPVMMGMHLRTALHDSLLIVGSSAGHSGPGLPPERGADVTAETTFDQLHEPLFWLDVPSLRADPRTASWIAERHPLRANFDTVIDVNLGEAFDAMVYVDTASPAHLDH